MSWTHFVREKLANYQRDERWWTTYGFWTINRGKRAILPASRLVLWLKATDKNLTLIVDIDCEEAFATVLKQSALPTVLGIVVILDLQVMILDVKTAFLYGQLEEEIYMPRTKGFVIAGRENEACRPIDVFYYYYSGFSFP